MSSTLRDLAPLGPAFCREIAAGLDKCWTGSTAEDTAVIVAG